MDNKPGLKSVIRGTEAADPFNSSSDEFNVMQSFSVPGDKLPEWMSVVQEFGEQHLLVCSENADPNASELGADSTDVGDWVSFSATNGLGDGDRSGSLDTECLL